MGFIAVAGGWYGWWDLQNPWRIYVNETLYGFAVLLRISWLETGR